MRRIDHRSNLVKVRKCVLNDLPNTQIISVDRRKAEQVGGCPDGSIFHLIVNVLKKFLHHDMFWRLCVTMKKNHIGDVSVRWKTYVVKIYLIKAARSGLLRYRDIVRPCL